MTKSKEGFNIFGETPTDVIKRLQAEIAKREWLPIELAPKDGSAVIIFDQDGVLFGWFDDGLDDEGNPYESPCWYWFNQHETGVAEPTHFMPLPEPPK
jgi:hypothetical protein